MVRVENCPPCRSARPASTCPVGSGNVSPWPGLLPVTLVLLFDEPTTGLDAVTLDAVVQAIKQLRANSITLVISGRKTWARAAGEEHTR